MAKDWATSGVDLHLDLAGSGLRDGLERALRDAVRDGRLGPGTRLPSSRTLAADLGIARNTVMAAYDQLVGEGWLTAHQGSGTQVAAQVAAPGDPDARDAPPKDLPRRRFDLRPGSPDVASFPRAAWVKAVKAAVQSAPSDAFGYGDPRGAVPLREALAGYLSRARGVRAAPDRIVICTGFTQGLNLLCQVLADRGAATIACESHGLTGIPGIARRWQLKLRTLPVDERGADTTALGAADAAILTPAHQFPLGHALAPERRTAAVGWAREHTGLIVEDDYDGEFRYDRHPIGALQALAPDRVIYAGTASKALAPGIRLGWLVVPAALLDDVVAAKTLADRQGGVIEQLALAQFIETGAYDRHIRSRRLTYRRRRDTLVAALGRRHPDMAVGGIAAGMHATVPLPLGVREDEVVAEAARRCLALEGLDAYRLAGPAASPALVVGYSAPADHAFSAALARLCASLG